MDDEEPSVLLVGSDHPMLSAITRALDHHGVHVEVSPVDAMIDTVVAATPRLVLLVGDAAKRSGEEPLRQLRRRGLASSISVAVLMDEVTTHRRLQALANGATTVIARSASVDAIAQQIADAARSKGDSLPQTTSMGETTLSDLLDALGKRIVADLLPTVETETTGFAEVRLTLGGEREIAGLVDGFSADLKKYTSNVERFEYALSGHASTAELLGDEALAEARSASDISGLRILLADSDPARADAVAQTLRDAGALVIVTGLTPADDRFFQMRQFDPAVLLIGATDLQRATRLVAGIESDDRLRWASMLVVDWSEIHGAEQGGPDVSDLFGRLAALGDQERALLARAESGRSFDTRLEVMGPARTLRTLTQTPRPLRLTVHHPRAMVQVDLSEGLLVGSTGQVHGPSPESLEGSVALAALLALRSGRVEVQPVEQAAAVNVMSTVDNALSAAEGESPPIRRSEFPSRDSSIRHSFPRAFPAGPPAASADDATPAPLVAPPSPDEQAASAGGAAPSASDEAIGLESAGMPPTAAERLHRARVWLQRVYGQLKTRLSGSVTIAGRPVPLWLPVGGGAVAMVLILVAVSALSGEDDPEVAADAESTAVRTAPTGSNATGPSSATPRPAPVETAKPEALIDRVRRGEPDAIEKLEERPPDERTIEEVVALSEGKAARARAEVAALRKELEDSPKRLSAPEVQKKLVAMARDERSAPAALQLMADLPGAAAADLIYEVWVGTTERTPATQLAEELVYTKPVRDKASPALLVALDLRAAESCEEYPPIIERAVSDGDERSLHLLARLATNTRCRGGRQGECYPCLSGNETLTDALVAVRDRPAPEL